MIFKQDLSNSLNEYFYVMFDDSTNVLYLAFQNKYGSISSDILNLFITAIPVEKKLVLIPVDEEDADKDRYEEIVSHYVSHPEDIELLQSRYPKISTVIVKWIPFERERSLSGIVSKGYYSKLYVPDAPAARLKSKISEKETVSETDVYVSNQIVSAADLLFEDTIRDDMVLRASLKLVNRTGFTRASSDEQVICTNRLFLQYFYVHVAIRCELDTVSNAQQFLEYYNHCLTNIVDAEITEMFKLIADDAVPYLPDALDYEAAILDHQTIVESLRTLGKHKLWKKITNILR